MSYEDDEEDRRAEPVSAPQPHMIPVKKFTAYTGDGDPIEIVGVHLEDEELNFVALVQMEDGEIFPQVIHYSVFRSND